MTLARKKLISLDDTPYYHYVCRCVPKSLRGVGSAACLSVGDGPFQWT